MVMITMGRISMFYPRCHPNYQCCWSLLTLASLAFLTDAPALAYAQRFSKDLQNVIHLLQLVLVFTLLTH